MSATDPSRLHRHPGDGEATEVDATAPHDVPERLWDPAGSTGPLPQLPESAYPAHAAPLPGRPRRRVVAQVVVAVGLLLAVVGTVVGHAVWGPEDDGGGSPLEGPGWRDVEAPGDAAPAPTPDPEVVEPVSMPTTTTTEAPAPSPTTTVTTEPPATTTTTVAPEPTTTTTVEPTTITTVDESYLCARTGTQTEGPEQDTSTTTTTESDPPSNPGTTTPREPTTTTEAPPTMTGC